MKYVEGRLGGGKRILATTGEKGSIQNYLTNLKKRSALSQQRRGENMKKCWFEDENSIF